MPAKRRREEPSDQSSQDTNLQPGHSKQLSAIAAARLRVDVSSSVTINTNVFRELDTQSTVAMAESPPPRTEDSGEQRQLLAPHPHLKLCNWRHDSENILVDTAEDLTIKLIKNATVAVLGCYHLRVLKGAININGANIGAVSHDGRKDQSYTVFAPATHPILKIRGLDSISHVQFKNFATQAPLADISPLFAGVWVAQHALHDIRSFSIVTHSDLDPLARPLVPEKTPEEWLRAIEGCAATMGISFLVGPPNTGKSTFAKRLINRLLTGQGKSSRPVSAVCYLNLDPQHTEYTPQGEISLAVIRCLNLGPNFTHTWSVSGGEQRFQNELIRSHIIPLQHDAYAVHNQACIEDLFLAYQKLCSYNPPIPLVVDVPGALFVSGFEYIQSLLTRYRPHSAVHIANVDNLSSEMVARLGSLRACLATCHGTVHEITTQLPMATKLRSEIELRAMQMQSYFHSKNKSINLTDNPEWDMASISKWEPWEFCYLETKERQQDFVGFLTYLESVERLSLVQSLQGSIVKIVEITDPIAESLTNAICRTSKYQVPYFVRAQPTGLVEPLGPRASVVCTALVRGFDPATKVVQLLVPNEYEELVYRLVPDHIVFVSGCCDTPDWAYLEGTGAPSSEGSRKLPFAYWSSPKPWVENSSTAASMGYLNTARRVRKFQI